MSVEDELADLPERVSLTDSYCLQCLRLDGFSGFEPAGIWTDGVEARIRFRRPAGLTRGLLLGFELHPLILGDAVRGQEVKITVNGSLLADWKLTDGSWHWRLLTIDQAVLGRNEWVEINLSIPTCARPAAHGFGDDQRLLGLMFRAVTWRSRDSAGLRNALISQLGRRVGTEASRSFDRKLLAGFWDRFIGGPKVLDIGFKGYHDADQILPIVEGAIGVDVDYPGYDGRRLPFPDDSQDAVYSSHCLEHIPDYINSIRDWHRVTKPGGHIITVVPSAHLYERRRRPPSRWNEDHRRFYTPGSLLAEFEAALAPNTYRVRHLADNDEGYDYTIEPGTHPNGPYEIELVIQKILPPAWKIED